MSSPQSTSSDIATGIATFERIKTFLSIFIFIIILGIMTTTAFYLYNDKHTSSTQATIQNAICTPVQNSNPTQYTCNLSLFYTIDNKVYSNKITITSMESYVKGQTIQILYNPENPNDIISGTSPKTIAYFLFVLIPIITILYIFNVYFVFKSKAYATTVGAIDITTSLFGR